jgi:hypothetical protein
MLDHVQVNWPKEYRHPVDTLSYPSQFDNGVEDGISGFFRAIPIVLRMCTPAAVRSAKPVAEIW